MELIDWLILSFTLIGIVVYGTLKTRGSKSVKDYVRGGNQAKWWTIGLSVMATQASAITFLSTPGQAFHDGLGFVQFYFGVPIAMVIICMVFIPIYHKLKVYTAYEILEGRFDVKTRSLTATFFLMQRGIAAGITIYAPAIILSAVLGWNLNILNIIIGLLVIIYTVSGGTRAVSVTQKQQMAVIFTGMFIAFFAILHFLPEDITFQKAMDIAAANGKMNILDYSFDLDNRYTMWSGLIGGTFLALSYFGADQSQVQRYLSGRSMKEMQMGMIFNGLMKVPMQFFILLVGIMVFVFYQFNLSPLNFNPSADKVVKESIYAEEYLDLEKEQIAIFQQRQETLTEYATSPSNSLKEELVTLNLKERQARDNAKNLIDKAAKDKLLDVETNDKDYVFIHFILNNMPRGIIGLLLAVILSAAMSSTASELNALASTTALDIYRRNYVPNQTQQHYVRMTKWFTFGWGILAIIVACVAYLAENLIELVNIIGSVFYGNILGIFLLAFFFKKIKANPVFVSAIITQIMLFTLFILEQYEIIKLPYLWLNFVGCVIVIVLAHFLQAIKKPDNLKSPGLE